MPSVQLKELLLQSLEHERCSVVMLETGFECVMDAKLRDEWSEYLAEVRTDVNTLVAVCETLKLDPERMTSGRKIVQHVSTALVNAMKMALGSDPPEEGQLAACQCLLLARTRHHLNWKLIGVCADKMDGEEARALQAACHHRHDDEDERLRHTRSCCLGFWCSSLGMMGFTADGQADTNMVAAPLQSGSSPDRSKAGK